MFGRYANFLYAALPRGTRLAMAGVLLLLIVVASLLGWWLGNSHDSAEQRAAVEAYGAARLLEQRVLSTDREIDMMLDDIAHEAERLPVNPPVEWSLPIGFEALMMLRDKPERLPHMAVLAILDAQGRVAYSATSSQGESFADMPSIKQLIAHPQQKLVISAPHKLRNTSKYGLAFAKPVLDGEGKLRAIILAGIHIEAWARHFEGIELGPHGAAVLYDQQNRMVARRPLPKGAVIGQVYAFGKQVPSPWREDTYFMTSDIDGEQRLQAVRSLQDYPLQLGVGLAAEDYLADWHAAMAVALVGVGALLAFGGWLLFLLWQSGRQALALAEREARLVAQEHRMRRIVEASPSALGVVDFATDQIRYVNPEMAALFGKPAAALAGQTLATLFTRPETWRACSKVLAEAGTLREMEYAVLHHDGREQWVSLSATVLDGTGKDDLLISLVDITSRHARETRLSHEAVTDALTGLANRRQFFERGNELFELARRYRRPFSLLMLDLDHFKSINDQYGHAVGDEVLVRVARLLEITLRQGDVAIRLGGEEFVALLPETPQDRAVEAAERIREAIEDTPLTLEDGRLVPFAISVGVASLPERDVDLPTLLAAADAALYRAKANGRNRVEVESI